MRVLMVCPELPTASSPGSMAPGARQIESIRAQGLDVDVIDMRGIPMLKYLLVLPKVWRHARNVDVVHAHFGYCGWIAKLAQFFAMNRRPVVMSFMGDDLLGSPSNEAGDFELFSRIMVRLNKRLAKWVDRVIVKSHEMAQAVKPVQATVIPNGVNIEVFQPIDLTAAREELNFDANPKVLFPGDPNNPRKGHQLASAAVAKVREQMKIPVDLVPLWGVSPDRVALYMNACDVMVMTSLIEGSPNVVKEALACNTPVVSVPVGDAHEQVAGVGGCYATSRSVDELAAAIGEVIRIKQRSEGRSAILERELDLDSVALRVIQEYQKALSKSSVETRRDQHRSESSALQSQRRKAADIK